MRRCPQVDDKKPRLPALLQKIQPVRDQPPSGPVGHAHRNALHLAALTYPQCVEAARAAPAVGREQSVQRLRDGEVFRVLNEAHAAAIYRGHAVDIAGTADLSRKEERSEKHDLDGCNRSAISEQGTRRTALSPGNSRLAMDLVVADGRTSAAGVRHARDEGKKGCAAADWGAFGFCRTSKAISDHGLVAPICTKQSTAFCIRIWRHRRWKRCWHRPQLGGT